MAGAGPEEPGRPTADRVRGIFSRIAPAYDPFNMLSSFGMDRLWRRSAVRAARIDREDVVLDLASGTGDLAFALARIGRPLRVVGTDFTPEMLAVAERKMVRYHGVTEVTFREADAQDLPFADGTFDVVTVGFGVRNLPDRRANFRETLRVLKPGGRYVILEFSTPPWRPFRGVYHFYLRRVIPVLGGLLSGDKASFQYLNESILRFPDQRSLASELEEAGFSAVSWRNLTMGIVALHTAVK